MAATQIRNTPHRPPAVPRVFGTLKAGPYGVGYVQRLSFDPARTYRSPFDEPAGVRARPIIMNVWYPAAIADEPAMRVDDYLGVRLEHGTETEQLPSTLIERLEHNTRAIIRREVFERERAYLTSEQNERAHAMVQEPVFARRGAPPATGRFPLVISHPGLGGAFADNFVLAEYLASHGYVVVTSPFLPAGGYGLNVDWDPYVSVPDISFIIRHTAAWDTVDSQRVAVLGHSYGAQAALIYGMQEWRVQAVISVDSTIENSPPKRPFYELDDPKKFLTRFDKLRVPTLIFASSGSRDHSFFEKLRHADRRLVLVPNLDHNDFVAHGGVLRPYFAPEAVRAEGPNAPDKVLKSYRFVVEYTRRYLDNVLKGADERAFLESATKQLEGASHRHIPAEAGKYDPHTLVRLAVSGRVHDVRSRCTGNKECFGTLWATADALTASNRLNDAVEVFRVLCDEYPKNWQNWVDLADAWARLGKVNEARAALSRARTALTEDKEMKDYVREYFLKRVNRRDSWLGASGTSP